MAEPKTQQVTKGVSTPLNANTFTNGEKMFAGWNTARDGSGTLYPNQGNINISSDTTLYAQWTDYVYNITYNMNGFGSRPSNALTQYSISNLPYSPPNPTPSSFTSDPYGTRQGLTRKVTFNGWSPTSIPSGSTSDKTFVATWGITYTQKNPTTITLNHASSGHGSNSAYPIFSNIPSGNYKISFGTTEMTCKHKGSHSGDSHKIKIMLAYKDTGTNYFQLDRHCDAIQESYVTGVMSSGSATKGYTYITDTSGKLVQTLWYNTTKDSAYINFKLKDFNITVPSHGSKNQDIYLYLETIGTSGCDGGTLSFSVGASITLTKL